MKVTFIGLGIMGSRMAANLLKSGTELTVFNRSEEPMKSLEKNGAKVAPNLEKAVSDADVVFTMLSNPNVVSKVMTDEILQKMKPGSLWIDCSTVNPSFSNETSKRAINAGIRFMDGPVAGSKGQAENAELVFLIGGAKKDLEQVESLLLSMGSKALHIGETGKGSSFKMVVNMLLAHNMVAFSEAVLFGQSMGIEKNFLLDVVPNLPVSAPFTKFKAENIRNDDWEEQFPLELMHKDLHLASITGYEKHQPLPMTNLTKELYGMAKKQGMGRLDMAAIFSFLEQNA